MNIDKIKYWLEDQIEFEENMVAKSMGNENDLNYCWGKNNLDIYYSLQEIIEDYCNRKPLQVNKKKCGGCGEWFMPVNQKQETCSGKCRVRMHRAKSRLKDFNTKVGKILKSKNEQAQYTVEQKIVENGKCPFVVFYNGVSYEADNTKSLLTQLKKI